MPKWMASIDTLSPKGLGIRGVDGRRESEEPAADGCRCAGPRAARLSITDAAVSMIVFVVVASLTIANPGALLPPRRGRRVGHLESLKGWLAIHNAAVTTVLFVVFGSTSSRRVSRR